MEKESARVGQDSRTNTSCRVGLSPCKDSLYISTIRTHHDPSPSRLPLRKVAPLYIPRHGRELDRQPVQLLAHLYLAPQPASLGQAKGQVQHVVFVVVGLRHAVVHVWVGHDDVAGRAGAGAAAGSLHLEVVCLGNVQEVGTVGDGEGVGLAQLVDEGYVPPGES